MEILALSILIIFSLTGFIAIFFTTFGTLIIFIGSILYSLITGLTIFDIKILLILLLLYLLGETLEYVFIIWGAKKMGASNTAVLGAIIGGILGAVIGVVFFGIGIFLGTLLGIFSGAFIVEYVIQRNLVKSLKSGTGGVLGRIGSIIAKVAIAMVMFTIMATAIIKN